MIALIDALLELFNVIVRPQHRIQKIAIMYRTGGTSTVVVNFLAIDAVLLE